MIIVVAAIIVVTVVTVVAAIIVVTVVTVVAAIIVVTVIIENAVVIWDQWKFDKDSSDGYATRALH